MLRRGVTMLWSTLNNVCLLYVNDLSKDSLLLNEYACGN